MTSNPSSNGSPDHEPDIDRDLDDLAHALRSPLTALRGGLEMLDEAGRQDLGDAGLRGLDVALSATRRLTALIDDTLLIAQHRAGRLEPRMTVTSATDVIGEALRQNPRLENMLQRQVESDASKLELVADVDLVATVIGRLAGLLAPGGEQVSLQVSSGDQTGVFELHSTTAVDLGAGRAGNSAVEACRLILELHQETFSFGPGDNGGTIARFALPSAE